MGGLGGDWEEEVKRGGGGGGGGGESKRRGERERLAVEDKGQK